MQEPYIGTIQICSFPFAPKGWAFCQGQTLPIAQNQALFAVLGTSYGGDGRTTFALPDLRGRVPLHFGTQGNLTVTVGQTGGAPTHTLSQNELPQHTHGLQASSQAASTTLPDGAALASAPLYVTSGGSLSALANTTLSPAGGSQPHNNMPPVLALNFIIALQGIFPSRS
ncbi:tail fiber protein [Deinococcus sp. HMF7604]|uniref:phage tail protein n=1 Tax=Deinococcus betulae TaxID=2873312 RepID=UPI001CC8FE35|nr:tail fiber protein [Deinococcus betulae]MBZ9750245.1 tail fiber protein [Deinococcus betulae]